MHRLSSSQKLPPTLLGGKLEHSQAKEIHSLQRILAQPQGFLPAGPGVGTPTFLIEYHSITLMLILMLSASYLAVKCSSAVRYLLHKANRTTIKKKQKLDPKTT